MDVITYPFWDLTYCKLAKGAFAYSVNFIRTKLALYLPRLKYDRAHYLTVNDSISHGKFGSI